jgi:hypothetical protein
MQHSTTMGVSADDIDSAKAVYKDASKKGLSKIENLAGFWPLNGDGVDGSGNGLDGTVVGAVEWAIGVHGPGRLGAVKRHSRFPMKVHFARGFCMGAHGA